MSPQENLHTLRFGVAPVIRDCCPDLLVRLESASDWPQTALTTPTLNRPISSPTAD